HRVARMGPFAESGLQDDPGLRRTSSGLPRLALLCSSSRRRPGSSDFAFIMTCRHWAPVFAGATDREMPLRKLAWCLTVLVALGIAALSPLARAGVVDAAGANLRVDLYTYGPGAVYWERFGHDALVLTDTASGEAYAFNYGLFDFEQKDFYFNFARGIMIYRAAAWPAADDIQEYSGEGRSITDQHLDLTPAQRAALRDFLVWNVQPEHSRYRYRYFADNCTTRVRDALDKVLDG